uniref:GH18 domain-containing protein n=1 Tax=Quercus lobata TaxID=97700 RepID=A0A7N2L263_QUELO
MTWIGIWVHVLAYDYYTPKLSNYTGAHAALYDPSRQAHNTDYGIGAWIGRGLSASKLVLGLPFYGYAWRLKNPNDNAIGALATGPAAISTDGGAMCYKDIKGYVHRAGAAIMYNATYVVNLIGLALMMLKLSELRFLMPGRRSYLVTLCGKSHMMTIGYFLQQVGDAALLLYSISLL